MSFTSPSFFVFLAACCAAYYLAPRRWQNSVLLVCSLWFAAACGAATLAVLCAEILCTYGLALALGHVRPERRRRVLIAGVVGLLAALIALKYSGMLLDTAAQLWPALADVPALSGAVGVLGISYYTLMAIGYLADVYSGRTRPERSLWRLALFLSFFPQFVSGPIGRAGELLPQFDAPRPFDYDRFAAGLTRMLLGYFKKLVIADSLALAVDPVFERPAEFSGPAVLLASLAFSYQLYCDFSGYTDIARGMGEVFGISLRENFRRPFAARSYGELWNRWHLSLSQWFRDYVYIPLGGSRRGLGRLCLATMAVFSLSGLWHNAGWLFLLWGVVNGLVVLEEKLTRTPRRALAAKLPGYEGSAVQSVWQRVRVYLLFSLCFVLFRVGENTGAALSDGLALYRQMLSGWGVVLTPPVLIAQLKAMSIGRKLTAYLAVSLALNEGLDWLAARRQTDAAGFVRLQKPAVRIALYYALALLILFFGQLGSSSFIYFQFNGR